MVARVLLAAIVLFQTCYCTDIPGVKTSETYTHSSILDTDGNYILFWKFNETYITFEAHVRTKG